MLQREAFLAGEANAWFERNKSKLLDRNKSEMHSPDPILEMVRGLKPKSVLEIGCSYGHRLEKLVDKGYCESAVGVDPIIGGYLGEIGKVIIFRGTAEQLPLSNTWKFDVVIFGFCLYLADPCDYFRIACEADRVLADGGYLIVHDFRHGPYEMPYKVPYEHKDGLFSYHADFAQLWAGNPVYSRMTYVELYQGCRIPGGEQITLLHKDVNGAFATRPAAVV